MALLCAGDEVLIPDNAYGPNKALAEGELKNWGISHQLYDPMDPADLRARIGPKTRLVWLEAPGSVTMEFVPLAQLAQICRERGVTSALDNTWGAGLAFNGFDLGQGDNRVADSGADIVVHALTKYPSGGGDVLMGSIVTRDDALHLKLKLAHMRLGFGVGANDAETVLRSLPSMELRYRAHDQAARQLAAWLQGRAEIAQLLHPAFEGSPATATGRRCAPAAQPATPGWPRACSRWCSTSATARPWSTRSATPCACSSWGTPGAGRSAWWCPTTCRRCAAPGSAAGVTRACWCGSRSAWRR
jgi:cystathionine beta-lyase